MNECESNPCNNAGTCVDMMNNYVCICTPMYTGVHCETKTDPCYGVGDVTVCRNDGVCSVDEGGIVTCRCRFGYEGLVLSFVPF